jgi:hypothetical protein
MSSTEVEDTNLQPVIIPILKGSDKDAIAPLSDSEESESDNDDPGMSLRFGRKRVNFSQDS